ncbi:dehydration-responsive element-binding protein 1B-like, partial [Morus notabilis]
LPVPASADAKDIQKAASEAAEAFRPVDMADDTGEKPAADAAVAESDNVFFMDEEAVFGMPGLLTNMAEGMLLPPPHCMEHDYSSDDVEAYADVSLWSYSA